jgi:hypothetical protein
MTACSHLDEVRQALAQGHWPDACTPELREHAKTCTRCAQEIVIATHLQRSRTATIASAQTGTPSLLWWRAQLRRRNAALHSAGRPIAAAQVFALIIAIAAMAGLIAAHWHGLLDRVLSAQGVASLAAIRGDWGIMPLILAITFISTLGGVVLYISTARE